MMETRTVRPGGLTVLSILNFIFGGIQAIGVLFSFASLGCTVTIQGAETHPNVTVTIVIALINTAVAAMLITSGAGCLKVHPGAGRWAANIYVILVIVRLIVRFTAINGAFDTFNMFTIIGLLYPLLVLFFVNIVFRDVWREREPVTGRSQPDRRHTLPHIALIGANSIRQTLRSSAGITMFLAVMIIGLFTAQLLLLPTEFLNKQPLLGGGTVSREQTVAQLENMAVPLIGRILGNVTNEPEVPKQGLELIPLQPQLKGEAEGRPEGDAAPQKPRMSTSAMWASFLMRERPGFLSVLYLLFCLILPSILLFSGFNQISEDARNKGLRYLLMRTRRVDVFFGKYVGSVITTFLLLVLLLACILLYIGLKLDLYETGMLFRWGLRGLFSFFLISLPVVAIAISFSGMIDSGIGSLGAGLGTLIIVPLLFLALKRMWDPLHVLQYILPYKLSFYLFHPQWWVALLSGAAMVGYAAVYLRLGYIYFKRRNL